LQPIKLGENQLEEVSNNNCNLQFIIMKIKSNKNSMTIENAKSKATMPTVN
jgi:hypothetical protein